MPPASTAKKARLPTVDEIRARLSDPKRDAPWVPKLNALTAIEQIVARGGTDALPPHAQREIAPGVAAQFTTERSALVAEAARVVEGIVRDHGRAFAPLIERLLYDLLLVSGAGNKTIAARVRPVLAAIGAACPTPRAFGEAARAFAASKAPGVHEGVFRLVNAALAGWDDAAMRAVDKDPSRDLCVLVLAGVTSGAETCRRIGRINFRLLRLRYPRIAAALELRHGAKVCAAQWKAIVGPGRAEDDAARAAAAGDGVSVALAAGISPSDEDVAGGPWAGAAAAAAAGADTDFLGPAAVLLFSPSHETHDREVRREAATATAAITGGDEPGVEAGDAGAAVVPAKSRALQRGGRAVGVGTPRSKQAARDAAAVAAAAAAPPATPPPAAAAAPPQTATTRRTRAAAAAAAAAEAALSHGVHRLQLDAAAATPSTIKPPNRRPANRGADTTAAAAAAAAAPPSPGAAPHRSGRQHVATPPPFDSTGGRPVSPLRRDAAASDRLLTSPVGAAVGRRAAPPTPPVRLVGVGAVGVGLVAATVTAGGGAGGGLSRRLHATAGSSAIPHPLSVHQGSGSPRHVASPRRAAPNAQPKALELQQQQPYMDVVATPRRRVGSFLAPADEQDDDVDVEGHVEAAELEGHAVAVDANEGEGYAVEATDDDGAVAEANLQLQLRTKLQSEPPPLPLYAPPTHGSYTLPPGQTLWQLTRDVSRHRRAFDQDALSLARRGMAYSRELDAAVDKYEWLQNGMGMLGGGSQVPAALRAAAASAAGATAPPDAAAAVAYCDNALGMLAHWRRVADDLEAHLVAARREMLAHH